MAASSAAIFCSSNRHFSKHLIIKNPPFPLLYRKTRPLLQTPSQFPSLSLHPRSSHSHFFNRPTFGSHPLFRASNFSIPNNQINRIFFGSKENSLHWNFAWGRTVDDRNSCLVGDDEGPEVAVVLMGWLGAKSKHLRRYVELYNARGIHAVTFRVSVIDVLFSNLGQKLEERIAGVTQELSSWLLNEDGGRKRFLIFHTFSNTGWLAYGAILANLKERRDLLERIKGCVVDSGGDPNIDPKVWAAGFTTALLKKSSSATYPSVDAGQESGNGTNGSKIQEKEPFLLESLLFSAFEKLFSYLLNLPNINQRLTKIISALTNSQPSYPQLYLYSSGDKVIPHQAVESFIEEQKRNGKQVFSFNFVSSPHVDHYRTFPDVYASQLHDFLKECLTTVGKL